MSNITFDKKGKTEFKKEDIEWLRIWCEDVNEDAMPRIALIGDSITEGYYKFVKEALKGVAKVDYLATSYSIVSDMYSQSVHNFVEDSEYAVIHYNYGLHAFSVDDEVYEQRCREILCFLKSKASVVCGTTTTVLDKDLKSEDNIWKDKVCARNERLISVAESMDLSINHLNLVCREMDSSLRSDDGVHYTPEGYAVLADAVVESIRKVLG